MGKKTRLITMTNKNGMEACITNYGARVLSLCVPDKNGKPTDVVLGFDISSPGQKYHGHVAYTFSIRQK